MKMPLGREVDVGPGDIVLDGDPPPRKGHGRHVVLDGAPSTPKGLSLIHI